MKGPTVSEGSTRGRDAAVVVVTVCLNAEKTIGECIASVAVQTHPSLEHLVVDGGSKDRTLEIARAHDRAGMRIVEQRDSGIYDAMNKALDLVPEDRWVIFLNADDRFSGPDALSNAMLHVGTSDLICTKICWISSIGRPILVMGEAPTIRALRRGMVAHHQGLIARRVLFDKLGRFDTAYRIGADYDWLVRGVKSGSAIEFRDLTLSEVRLEGASEKAQVVGALDRARVALNHFGPIDTVFALSQSIVPDLLRSGIRGMLRKFGLLEWLRRVRGIDDWRPGNAA